MDKIERERERETEEGSEKGRVKRKEGGKRERDPMI